MEQLNGSPAPPVPRSYEGIREGLPFGVMAALLSLSYASMRFQFNIEYQGAPWKKLYDLSAAIPYANRVLVPLLSRPLVALGATVKGAYFFWEAIFCLGLVLMLNLTLRSVSEERWAKVWSLGFLVTLPMAFLLRFKWPVFYPSDTPALFFTVCGIYFLMRHRFKMLVLLVFVATLNRESSILLVLIAGIYGVDRLPLHRCVLVFAACLIAYWIPREGIANLMSDNPTPFHGGMAWMKGKVWRVQSNIVWLKGGRNLGVLVGTMGFIPLAFASVLRDIPPHLRRFFVPVVPYCGLLFFIGNYYEPRIFGEPMVLLYIPLVAGLYQYMTHKEVGPPVAPVVSTSWSKKLVRWIEIWIIPLTLCLMVGGWYYLKGIKVTDFY